jgi:hypothetical protein
MHPNAEFSHKNNISEEKIKDIYYIIYPLFGQLGSHAVECVCLTPGFVDQSQVHISLLALTFMQVLFL